MTTINRFRLARLLKSFIERSEQADVDICVENIGPMERHKRLRFGIITLGASLLLASLLLLLGTPRWVRFILFIPLAISAVGFNQARART